MSVLLAGCALTPPEPTPEVLAIRQSLLETALGQIGRPYVWGGTDGEGFDCSGLSSHVYAEIGIRLPRTAAAQLDAGDEIDLDEAWPGDLVFFDTGSGTHVGIYVGGHRVVHAPAAGKQVTVTSIDTPYWQDRFEAAVRVLQ